MTFHLPRTADEYFGWAFIAFLLGVAAHSVFPWTHVPIFFLTAVICGSAFILLRRFKGAVFRLLPLMFLSLALGVWRFDISIPQSTDGVMVWIGRSVEAQGMVVNSAAQGKTWVLTVRVATIESQMLVRAPRDVLVRSPTELEAGSPVSVRCLLRVPGTFPSNLERRGSLARKGVWAECGAGAEVESLGPASFWNPLTILARWRALLRARIGAGMPTDEAALVAGILYGDQDLGTTLKNDFRTAGLMHIVAVSGSNVTIVVSVISILAGLASLRRRHAFWLTTGALFIFLAFVGFSASVLRAAFMGWLALLARELGRIAWADRLLVSAAVILTLLNPWLLCFDAGFALSFLAIWGLMSWTPMFMERLSFLPKTLAIRESVATTLGATIMTAPYLAWVFGQMTLAGLFTNVLALPLIPWTMLWGAIAAAWGSIGAPWMSLPASGLAHLLILIAQLSRLVPWLDLQIPHMDAGLMAASYLLLWRWYASMRDERDLSTENGDVGAIFCPPEADVEASQQSLTRIA